MCESTAPREVRLRRALHRKTGSAPSFSPPESTFCGEGNDGGDDARRHRCQPRSRRPASVTLQFNLAPMRSRRLETALTPAEGIPCRVRPARRGPPEPAVQAPIVVRSALLPDKEVTKHDV